MIKNIVKPDFSIISEALSGYLTPITYNIADGIASDIISYPILKLLTGEGKKVFLLMYILFKF